MSSFGETLKAWGWQIGGGVIIAMIVGFIYAFPDKIGSWLGTPPRTWNIGSTFEWSIRPLIEENAKPQLARPCARSRPLQWFHRKVFGEECVRLTLDPPELIKMKSRRGPFKETDEPYRLLELFIDHHKGCLTLTRRGEKLVIREANPSKILRFNGQIICPE